VRNQEKEEGTKGDKDLEPRRAGKAPVLWHMSTKRLRMEEIKLALMGGKEWFSRRNEATISELGVWRTVVD